MCTINAGRVAATNQVLLSRITSREFLVLTIGRAAMKTVQLPDEIYQQAAKLAESDHVSVDRLVAALVSEGVGNWSKLQARASRGSVDKLKRVLSKVADTEPESADRL